MKRIYISGKIGNLPIEIAKTKFGEYANILREQGHRPMNPFENGVETPENMPLEQVWETHMKADIIMLCECDECHMLPCWKDSRGAKIEHDLAVVLGIPVTYLS